MEQGLKKSVVFHDERLIRQCYEVTKRIVTAGFEDHAKLTKHHSQPPRTMSNIKYYEVQEMDHVNKHYARIKQAV